MLTAEPTRLAGLPMWILWDFSSYNCQCGNTILQPFTFQTSALESLLLSREEQRDERSLGELHSFFSREGFCAVVPKDTSFSRSSRGVQQGCTS